MAAEPTAVQVLLYALTSIAFTSSVICSGELQSRKKTRNCFSRSLLCVCVYASAGWYLVYKLLLLRLPLFKEVFDIKDGSGGTKHRTVETAAGRGTAAHKPTKAT